MRIRHLRDLIKVDWQVLFDRALKIRAMIVAFALLASAWPALAAPPVARLRAPDGSSVIVSADRASRDSTRQIDELTGNVQIIYNQQAISCDHAFIDYRRQEVTASGNLVIASPTAYLEGDQAVLNLTTNTGVITNGFVKSGQVLFEGRTVRKTGPETYEAETASYTACTTCPPGWTFVGTSMKAEMGGYAHIKYPVLEIGGVPVIWLPYLIVPLKSERQSGLLIPSFDYDGVGGAAISLHGFWAISRSQDAMLTLKNYEFRGLKSLFNYRYVLNDTSFGEANGAFIRDQVFISEQEKLGRSLSGHEYRWFTTYNHVYELPNQFTQRMKLNLVSDLRYTRDFPDEIAGQGDDALDNRISLTRNSDSFHTSLDSSYYINQLKEDPLSSNQDAIHRLPELRLAMAERNLFGTNLLLNFNADYVNFAREDFAYDDVFDDNGKKTIDSFRNGKSTGSGQFNPETDIVRSGQRFDFTPELSYPIHFGPLIDVLPSMQFRHTQYSFNVTPPENSTFDAAPSRDYVRGRISARTVFSRVYGRGEEQTATPPPPPRSWSDAESIGVSASTELKAPVVPPSTATLYKHEISPEVTFAGVPWLSQSQSSFFGKSEQVPVFLTDQPISDSDFYSGRGIQFDYYDRVTERNSVTFSLNNRLVRKRFIDGAADYRQIASFRLSQSYDFDEAQRPSSGQHFPWSGISGLLDVRLDNFETNTLVRYFPYHNVVNTSSRATIKDARGDYFQLNFAQTYLITEKPEEAYPGRTENVGFEAGFDTRYLTFAGALAYQPTDWSRLNFVVKSWSALMTIKPPGNCWGIRATIRQDIGAALMYKLNFDFKFGGEKS